MIPFFDRPDTKWARPDGCLHFYALPSPDAPIVDAFERMAEPLVSMPQLGIQPPEHLHMTLQRLTAFEDDLTEEKWVRLRKDLGGIFGLWPTFSVRLGPPSIEERAIEAVGGPSVGWSTVVAGLRDALVGHGMGTLLTDPPYGPHITLAYCRDAVEDQRVAEALGGVARPTELVVDRVALVSVTQDPASASFAHRVVQDWPLGRTGG